MKVTFVNGSNWVGLYIDGELKYEDHDIEPDILLDYLKLDYDWYYADETWLGHRGRLPQKIDDVVLKDQSPIVTRDMQTVYARALDSKRWIEVERSTVETVGETNTAVELRLYPEVGHTKPPIAVFYYEEDEVSAVKAARDWDGKSTPKGAIDGGFISDS
jgi:hypothetical protein